MASTAAEERAKRTRESRDELFSRQRAYLDLLGKKSPGVLAILDDLARFCRAEASTFHVDARAHALIEGRREVWLRIQDHLKLDSEELWKKYSEKKGATP